MTAPIFRVAAFAPIGFPIVEGETLSVNGLRRVDLLRLGAARRSVLVTSYTGGDTIARLWDGSTIRDRNRRDVMACLNSLACC